MARNLEPMIYDTLDGALADVAARSFYEDCTVTPVARGYAVRDDVAYSGDGWVWSYDEGVHDRDSVSEVSRLMDPCEVYTSAEHIRYFMRESVEVLEAGTHEVTFGYAPVDALEVEDCCECDDEYGCECDRLVGWILTATHWEEF